MHTWLFDVGNSRLKFAPLRSDGGLGEVCVCPHDGQTLPAGWEEALPARFDAAEVALVAPASIRAELLDVLAARAQRVSLVATIKRCAGVEVAYIEPQRFGVDRFLTLLAAHARAGEPWLLVGVGTALTIDLLDANGQHLGGRIAASPTLLRQALHERAVQLPTVGGEYVAFAGNTEDALASGCLGATIGLIEHSLRAARDQLGRAPQLLVHGGGAQALLAFLPETEYAPSLVLEGLAEYVRFMDAGDC